MSAANASTATTAPALTTILTSDPDHDEDYYTRPDFIYGGPFIPIKLPSPFLDIGTPMNVPLSGIFRKYVLRFYDKKYY